MRSFSAAPPLVQPCRLLAFQADKFISCSARMGTSGRCAAAATTSTVEHRGHKPHNTITITPTTAARRLLAYLTVLSPFCIMRSQALSAQPVILELDEQATPPGVPGAWPRASIACSLIPPHFWRLATAVDPMPRPSCPCSVGAPIGLI